MSNSVATPPRRRARRGLEIALFLLVAAIAAALVIGTMRVRGAQQERAAVRRVWRLGTVVVFEGSNENENPPLTPGEWDAEFRRSWFDDLTAAPPTRIMFVRFSRFVDWPEPIVDDDDIPELIDILRRLPTVTSVQLDENITPAGHARLKNALPAVRFRMPPRIP